MGGWGGVGLLETHSLISPFWDLYDIAQVSVRSFEPYQYLTGVLACCRDADQIWMSYITEKTNELRMLVLYPPPYSGVIMGSVTRLHTLDYRSSFAVAAKEVIWSAHDKRQEYSLSHISAQSKMMIVFYVVSLSCNPPWLATGDGGTYACIYGTNRSRTGNW